MAPRVCLQFVIVVIPDHTHILFNMTFLFGYYQRKAHSYLHLELTFYCDQITNECENGS